MSCTFVLVVEDDEDVRESLCTLLEDEGWRAVAVANGAEALAALRSAAQPCVILLDLMMPVMGGAEFRSRQLADAALADIPVVLITAAGRQAAMTVPVNRVLLKPVKVDALLAAVDAYC
jgi:CheY-like chemotaxis protein